MPLRVMICVDNSENAAKAFDYYVEHMHKPENEVIVYHVSDEVKFPTYALFAEGVAFNDVDIREKIEELRIKNKKLEDEYTAKCDHHHIKKKIMTVSNDSSGPGVVIVHGAKKHQVGLIVIGSRGLGSVKRVFMGSTSTYIVHHSHVPTIVCPKHH